MRKLVSLSVILLFFTTSCDFILKDNTGEIGQEVMIQDGSTEIVTLGEDSEVLDCAYSAGYRWSSLQQNCIRIFEMGMRLNPIGIDETTLDDSALEDSNISCFVLLSEDRKQAEVFLPNTKSGVLLTAAKDGSVYLSDGWELSDEGMVLKYKGEVRYTAAKTIELKIINTDQPLEEDGVFE